MIRHTYSFSLVGAAALCALVAACEGNVVHGSGAGTTGTFARTAGTGASSTGGGVSPPTGECKTDADCVVGTCTPITPGGYLVCLNPPPEATSCVSPMAKNQCCTSADCHEGKCYSTATLPHCAGPAGPVYNECLRDQCETDADCVRDAGGPPQICAPIGIYDYYAVRTCIPAYCRTNADCTAHPQGVCVLLSQPCCSIMAGLGCTYPGGCGAGTGCGMQHPCVLNPETGTAECSDGGICPI